MNGNRKAAMKEEPKKKSGCRQEGDARPDAAVPACAPADPAAELREKEAFNFALFQYNPAPMTVVDLEGRVVKSNLARRKAGALPPLGQPLFTDDIQTPDGDGLQSVLRLCIRRGQVRRLPEQPINGRVFDMTMAPFSAGAIVIMEDITSRKQAEEEARVQQQQLIQAQKMAALGTLVSGVAHEISNPNSVQLLSASALSRLLKDCLARLSDCPEARARLEEEGRTFDVLREEVVEHVEVIGRAAERIQNFVRELKDYARSEEALPTEQADLNQVVTNALTLLRPLIRKATNRFTVCCRDAVPPVRGNPRRLEQVVINLVSNACQALPDRDHGVRIETVHDCAERVVRLTVTDEGVGIPPEHLQRIKDPFFTTRQDAGGTGLGLSISEKIVSSYGGRLTFQSRVNEGTVAIVTLPEASP